MGCIRSFFRSCFLACLLACFICEFIACCIASLLASCLYCLLVFLRAFFFSYLLAHLLFGLGGSGLRYGLFSTFGLECLGQLLPAQKSLASLFSGEADQGLGARCLRVHGTLLACLLSGLADRALAPLRQGCWEQLLPAY